MTHELQIDVYSDLICPWCLIGKHNLRAALEQLALDEPGLAPSVSWHPVQLIPDVPDEGWDYRQFYLQRLGSAENVRVRQGQVLEAAGRAGVTIHFERISRFPSTRKAHQLLAFAAQALTPQAVGALMERLFEAFFQRGENMGELSVLQAIAAEHGLDAQAATRWIESGQGLPQAVAVPGVPFFVFNRSQALSGAQPPSVLLAAMRQAGASLAAQGRAL